MSNYLEHANITVHDPESTIKFLLTAIPEWHIRGKGTSDWFSKQIEWFHIGDDNSYIAIQSGGEEPIGQWKDHWSGVKHLGIVVPSLEILQQRLSDSGYVIDHHGKNHPHRKNVYYLDPNNIQFEFIQYLSHDPVLMNDYKL